MSSTTIPRRQDAGPPRFKPLRVVKGFKKGVRKQLLRLRSFIHYGHSCKKNVAPTPADPATLISIPPFVDIVRDFVHPTPNFDFSPFEDTDASVAYLQKVFDVSAEHSSLYSGSSDATSSDTPLEDLSLPPPDLFYAEIREDSEPDEAGISFLDLRLMRGSQLSKHISVVHQTVPQPQRSKSPGHLLSPQPSGVSFLYHLELMHKASRVFSHALQSRLSAPVIELELDICDQNARTRDETDSALNLVLGASKRARSVSLPSKALIPTQKAANNVSRNTTPKPIQRVVAPASSVPFPAEPSAKQAYMRAPEKRRIYLSLPLLRLPSPSSSNLVKLDKRASAWVSQAFEADMLGRLAPEPKLAEGTTKVDSGKNKATVSCSETCTALTRISTHGIFKAQEDVASRTFIPQFLNPHKVRPRHVSHNLTWWLEQKDMPTQRRAVSVSH